MTKYLLTLPFLFNQEALSACKKAKFLMKKALNFCLDAWVNFRIVCDELLPHNCVVTEKQGDEPCCQHVQEEFLMCINEQESQHCTYSPAEELHIIGTSKSLFLIHIWLNFPLKKLILLKIIIFETILGHFKI